MVRTPATFQLNLKESETERTYLGIPAEDWKISKGKSKGFQQLPPVPPAPKGLERSVARCFEQLDLCNY